MTIINARLVHETADWHKNRMPRGDIARAISQSDLKAIAENPHKWRYGEDQDEETDAMTWGRLVDAMAMPTQADAVRVAPATYLSEPKRKGDVPTEKPWNWNAGVCQAWRDAQPPDAIIVRSETHEAATEAVRRLHGDSLCGLLFKESAFQVGLLATWQGANGVCIPLCGLADMVPHAKTTYADGLADLKTTDTIRERSWQGKVNLMGYHIQAAFYLDLYNAATGEHRDTFRHVIQESEAPYEVAARQLSDENLSVGRSTYQKALRDYCEYVKADHWPTLDELSASRKVEGWTIVEPPTWAVFEASAKIEWPTL